MTNKQPPSPAVTVSVFAVASKAASTAAPAVTEPTGSAQGLASVPPAHASPSESVQPAKRWPVAGTAVSTAVADPTLTVRSCLEPAPTVTAGTVEAPAASETTEPPAPTVSVRTRSTGSKAAVAVTSALSPKLE